MRQAATGKWYAYVAERTSYTASGLTATGATSNVPEGEILKDLPALAGTDAWPTDGTTVQMYEFADGDDVEITAGRSESVTLELR